MDFEHFTNAILEEISRLLPDDTHAAAIRMQRGNQTATYGLYMERADAGGAPLLDLFPFYEAYRAGLSLHDAACYLLENYKNSVPFETSFPDFPRNAAHFREQIVIRLVHYNQNREWLRSVPHRRVLDLAFLCEVAVPHAGEGYGVCAVTTPLMKALGLNEETLFSLAWRNQLSSIPPLICPIEDILSQPSPTPVYVVTNQTKLHGACCLFYPGVLEELARRLESDLCILPSSIHEVLVTAWDETQSKEQMDEMVREINRSSVPERDWLSDHAYLYCRQSGQILL